MARRVVLEPMPHNSPQEDVDMGDDLLAAVAERQEQTRGAILSNIPAGAYRDKAEKILEKIWPFIRLTDDNEVLYWGKLGETEKGSHLLFLLQYIVLPEEEWEKARPLIIGKPLDFHKFVKILKMAGVRKSQLNPGIINSDEEEDEVTIGDSSSPLGKKQNEIIPWKKLY